MKIYLSIFLLAFIYAGAASAQDKIYTIQGDMIDGKVLAASVIRVKYQVYKGKDTFNRVIPGRFVAHIAYSNGTEWRIRHSTEREEAWQKKHDRVRKHFHNRSYRNSISLCFPQFHSIDGLIGLGGGISYERFIDKKGHLSLNIPIYYSQGTNGNSGSLKGVATYETCHSNFTIPGIHYHFFGNKRKNDLSVGVGAITGVFAVTEHHNYYGQEQGRGTGTVGMFGLVGQINYCLHATDHFMIGIEINYGTIISHAMTIDPSVFMIGLKLGGRF